MFGNLEERKMESSMRNREMLEEIKRVEPIRSKMRELADKIVAGTFDYSLECTTDLIVLEDKVEVHYDCCCRGEWGHDVVHVPIEWFDEGFDYKAAYTDMLKKQEAAKKLAEAARKRKEEAAKKRAKAKKAEKEFKTYLKLKEKYEAKESSQMKADGKA